MRSRLVEKRQQCNQRQTREEPGAACLPLFLREGEQTHQDDHSTDESRDACAKCAHGLCVPVRLPSGATFVRMQLCRVLLSRRTGGIVHTQTNEGNPLYEYSRGEVGPC